jgi:peroxiredoxin
MVQIIVLVAGWVLAAAAAWIAYRMMVERGKLLLQVEQLEQRVAAIPPRTVSGSGLPAGAPAPDFELPDLTGRMHSFSQWRSQQILLIFMDATCSFCRAMAPRLGEALRSREAGSPVPIIVSTGEVAANRAMFLPQGIHCPILLQEGAELARLYRAPATPSAYLIDGTGHIAGGLALGADEVLALLLPGTRAPDSDTAAHHAGQGVGHVVRPIENSTLTRAGLTAGTAAPAFSLPRIDGGTLSLADYQGRRVLLVFSDPDCAPCNRLAPELEQLHQDLTGLDVLMVSRGTLGANRARAEELGLTFPIALQRHWDVSRDYGMFATPIAYLIDERSLLASDVRVGHDSILELASSGRKAGRRRKEALAQG